MKRPANQMDAAHHEHDQEEDHVAANGPPNQERMFGNDVGCQHPINMRSAAGSNKYFARMVCRSCGLLLYKVERPFGPRVAPDPMWALVWDNLPYWDRIAILRHLHRTRRRRD